MKFTFSDYEPIFDFSTLFSNIVFVDLLESKSLSPNAGMKSDFILPTLAVSALLNIDENIPKQFKKFSKVKQQAHQAGSGTISMVTPCSDWQHFDSSILS